jgi:hypothetical protein
VTIVLFDLGRPGELYEENKQQQEAPLPETVVDAKFTDQYLHGNKAKDDETVNDAEISSNTEVAAYHEALKNKRKPRSKVKKAVLPDQQPA